ncbi:hypothetical protein OS493_004289 [Desmophyllum pertusum]|uniref:Kinesin motor domain-containing protein n=1 Tax=Desmophyllum pertusum TaxID=174260 RepID=A0A9W9ZT05_9CNID|nr:hypothetical protein OS493_004289 [Desmophyllum pertusum]
MLPPPPPVSTVRALASLFGLSTLTLEVYYKSYKFQHSTKFVYWHCVSRHGDLMGARFTESLKSKRLTPSALGQRQRLLCRKLIFVECDRLDDLTAVLEEGLRNRQVGSHLMNDHSSRSHSMLTVYIDIESNDPEDESGYPVVKHGKLSLVDLAGSERVKETKSVGGTFAESQNINKSLLTLGKFVLHFTCHYLHGVFRVEK